MAAKAQSKHEDFINKTSTAIGYTIIGLDYYIEDYQVTLHQAIMSIRSTTKPELLLFVLLGWLFFLLRLLLVLRLPLKLLLVELLLSSLVLLLLIL